jgi:hypothetical protein
LKAYDVNGNKIGPVKRRELIALAGNGIITGDTLVTDDKITVKTRAISILNFNSSEYTSLKGRYLNILLLFLFTSESHILRPE